MNELRWRQRFDNFSKVLFHLEKALKISQPSELEQAGIVQFFEMCFELGWKVLKDYVEQQGFLAPSPRAAIKTAFSSGIIKEAHLWMDALEKRNLMSHAYDEKKASEAVHLIKHSYLDILLALQSQLRDER